MNADAQILDAWRANNRAMEFLVENFPRDAWALPVPGSPRKTIRSVAAHVHNSRCMWFKSLATFPGFRMPARVDPRTVTPAALVKSLKASSRQMLALFQAGVDNGGDFPGVKSRFIWGAMPRNALLFLGYAIAHEGHHRGQILLIARANGHRLSPSFVGGLWQWSARLRECREEASSERRAASR